MNWVAQAECAEPQADARLSKVREANVINQC